jgi:AbiU2
MIQKSWKSLKTTSIPDMLLVAPAGLLWKIGLKLCPKIQKEFATERKSKLSATIEQTIPEIERFRQNRRLKALQNARNKHLAHNLTTTDLERRKKHQKTHVPKLKFGDETFILDQTVSFIETLHLCVCGTNAIAKESAKAHSRDASDL